MITDPRAAALEALEDNDYAEAERQLRAALTDEPDDAGATAMLALCLVEQRRYDEARAAADRVAALAPGEALGSWVHAVVLLARDRCADALPPALEAARRAPDDPDYHATVARAYLGLSRWQEALDAAEAGLHADPDHAASAGLRALALRQLGRAAEAEAAFEYAAATDPLDSLAVAGKGWSLLGRGEAADAAPHFRDALLVDPTSAWAREGLIASLKARNPLYRALLRYFVWSGTRTPRERMLLVFGGLIGYRMLRGVAREQPALAPVIWPVLGLYLAFVLLTWIGDPVFDLLLRLDPEGRRALTRDRVVASNWIGGVLATAVVAALAGLATGSDGLLILGALAGFLVLPLAGTFQCDPGWPRTTMAAYTATLGALAVVAAAFGGQGPGSVALGVAMLGAVLGTWLARWLASVVPAR